MTHFEVLSHAYTYLGGRPGSMTISAGGISHEIDNIRFAPFGGRESANFPPSNSVVSTRVYNRRGQVSSVLVSAPSGTVIDRTFNYSITGGGVAPNDPGPNLDQIIDGRDASQSRYSHYDTLDRVAKSAQLSGTSLYQYVNDSNGNRTIEVSGGTTTGLSYVPGTDRIATAGFSFGFGTITTYYHHDVYGNRIWEALLSQYSGQPTHDYDDENRLIEYRHWSNLSLPAAQYSYDVFGRRVRKMTASATTHFIYDSSGHLLEERVASTGATRNYAWLEDEPVAVVDSGAAPIFSWIHTDYLGMPIAVTDTPAAGNAATIWRANYAPFGLAGVFTDPDGNWQHFTLNLRFPGQYFDGESNYHYNWHRYYDPSIGRYISADPIGQRGGINVYNYAFNNPTNGIDPHGLLTAVVVGGPTPGNPFGHSAIATSGQGVTSFGTETNPGSSFTEYVLAQSASRDQTVYIIPTTPEQEAAIQAYLAQFLGEPLPPVPGPDSQDTCASRTGGALAAAGLYDPSNPYSTAASALGVHSPLPEANAAMGELYADGLSTTIPRGASSLPAIFRAFNP